MDTWIKFEACLKARPGTAFWWRDDDVGVGRRIDLPGRWMRERRLEKMLALLARFAIPSVFAVIPKNFRRWGKKQAELLRKYGAYVAMHGIGHLNYSESGSSPSEFPGGCDVGSAANVVLDCKKELADIFGDMFVAVFVPPWNNICRRFEERLPSLGFAAVSKCNTDAAEHDHRNVDIDFIDWGTRDLREEREILEDIMALMNNEDIKVIGLMNHHCLTGKRGLRFFERLFSVTTSHEHSNARWIVPNWRSCRSSCLQAENTSIG
jgi:peptidoglycan/xylan/chitin deacetylase (PgdA/CDA1 family)